MRKPYLLLSLPSLVLTLTLGCGSSSDTPEVVASGGTGGGTDASVGGSNSAGFSGAAGNYGGAGGSAGMDATAGDAAGTSTGGMAGSDASAGDAAGGEAGLGGEAGSDASTDAPTDGAGATCNGPAWTSKPACEACQKANCCITAGNCAGDADCVAIVDCVAGGGTSSQCYAGHAAGQWYFSGLIICLENLCATECGVAQAECGGIHPTPDSCWPEVQERCCDETAACGQSDACLAFVYQCLDQTGCAAQECYLDCLEQYPAAEVPFETLANCWGTLTCM